jgi:uncharacterized membrane protein YgdD (TMEM256/DUF423 family)
MRKWVLALAALAGLTGAGGVILSAVAAHGVADPRVDAAAHFLLFHATATLAVCGLASGLPQCGRWFLIPAGSFLLGSLLFGGDLSARVLIGVKLFPMAAPIGGILLVLGWILVTIAALWCWRCESAQS